MEMGLSLVTNRSVMTTTSAYDVAVIGGGIAGLCLSIQLAKEGYQVIVFEKESYPFHKVCGEYVSMESWRFLEELGVPLHSWHLPKINRLVVSSPAGTAIHHRLPLGGFGISRYKLDAFLAGLARSAGVEVMEGIKVDSVQFNEPSFTVQCGQAIYKSRLVCGAFGKRSNLDIKLERDFIQQKPRKISNYVAVKYHIKTDFPEDTIALHNFRNGYCGLSRIEEEKYCFCYMTTAQNLKNCNHSIDRLEQEILRRNPHLDKIFGDATFLYRSPLTISQIHFQPKTQIEDHILLTGDAAGMIPPLSGNGMTMAMHGSRIAFQQVRLFLEDKINREEMETAYQKNWNTTFCQRLKTGRWLQQLFGRQWVTDSFIKIMRPFPALTDQLIKKTHGKSF